MRAHMCSEFYTGWITHWMQGSFANTSSAAVASGIDTILQLNGSVSLYMGHGGTNWGLWSGANGGGTSYMPVVTSCKCGSGCVDTSLLANRACTPQMTTMRQCQSLVRKWNHDHTAYTQPRHVSHQDNPHSHHTRQSWMGSQSGQVQCHP